MPMISLESTSRLRLLATTDKLKAVRRPDKMECTHTLRRIFPSRAHFFELISSNNASSTMRSFATVATAAAVLSTASAFAPQAQRSSLSAAVSAPVTSNIVLNQAAEEVDPLDFTPEVRTRSFVSCPLMRSCPLNHSCVRAMC